MKRTIASSILLLLIVGGCSSGGSDPAAVQERFGVRMAKMNLWREAMFRFKRAVEMNPGDAMAHNNLAVAYEANGDFDAAAKEYREAIRLDRTNQYIQKNYSRFVEFTSRNRRRQQQQQQRREAAQAPASPTAAAPPTGSTPPSEPPSSQQPTATAPAAAPPTSPAPAPPQVEKPPGGVS